MSSTNRNTLSTRPYPNKTRIKTHPFELFVEQFSYKTISQQNKDEEMSSGHFDSEARRERRTERFHKPRAERTCFLCRGRKTSVAKQLTLWTSKSSSQQNKYEEMSSGHFDSEAQRERRTERFHKPRAERTCFLCRGRKTSVAKQLTLWTSKSSFQQNKD